MSEENLSDNENEEEKLYDENGNKIYK